MGIGQRAHESQAETGWWSEFFARQDKLQPLRSYLTPSAEVTAEAMAEAEMARWCASQGLVFEDIEDDDETS